MKFLKASVTLLSLLAILSGCSKEEEEEVTILPALDCGVEHCEHLAVYAGEDVCYGSYFDLENGEKLRLTGINPQLERDLIEGNSYYLSFVATKNYIDCDVLRPGLVPRTMGHVTCFEMIHIEPGSTDPNTGIPQ